MLGSRIGVLGAKRWEHVISRGEGEHGMRGCEEPRCGSVTEERMPFGGAEGMRKQRKVGAEEGREGLSCSLKEERSEKTLLKQLGLAGGRNGRTHKEAVN